MTTSFRQLMADVAVELGPTWTTSPAPGWPGNVDLLCEDGRALRAVPGADRIEFVGTAPAELRLAGVYVHHTRITVAVAKTPARIAAEVTSRLLPRFAEAVEAGYEEKRRRDAELAATNNVWAAVRDTLGPGVGATPASHGGKPGVVHWGSWDAPVGGSTEHRLREEHVLFTVRVRADLAVKLAAALAALTADA